jgi:cell wall-associated NlpC family hydrolase
MPTLARRIATAAGLGLAAAATAVATTAAPAAAGPHYPWQDPGTQRSLTEAAITQVGLSYCWGGGTATGPTYGVAGSNCNANTGKGFDCSGLVHYALARAGRDPGDRTADWYAKNLGTKVDSPVPGDLLFWDWDSNGTFDHTAIYLGRNRDNNKLEYVEANGAKGKTAATGHRVKISAYTGAHRIRRA